jgi:retinol dehydrogenase-12
LYAFTLGFLLLICLNNVCEAIKKATGTTVAECWTVDLADFKSISAFADRFEQEGGGRLDLLVENAGVVTRKFEGTKDGWEST